MRDGGHVVACLHEERVVLLKVQVCQPGPQYLAILEHACTKIY